MLLRLEGFLGSLLNLSELYTTATAATARWILFGSAQGKGGGRILAGEGKGLVSGLWFFFLSVFEWVDS